MIRYSFTWVIFFLMLGCASAKPIQVIPIKNKLYFGGWDYLASKLRSDGIPESLISAVYEDGSVVPNFNFVPFKLRPKETSSMYSGFQSRRSLKVTHDCYQDNKASVDIAASRYSIPPRLIVAFLSIETRCGKNFGNELVVNRLSRVASVMAADNLRKNYEEVLKEYPTATIRDVELRGQYLEQVFYPQLLALFQSHVSKKLNLFTLKGSVAGAFGYPQFLPKTYIDYGVDGNQDGRVDLFSADDAIFSVANFISKHGWNESISRARMREIIWHYNRSDPYIDSILFLSGL